MNLDAEYCAVNVSTGNRWDAGAAFSIDKPFWGESCPLKSCCEGKQQEHCGVCPDFPCEMLDRFAHDKEQGDDGKRIQQCGQWRDGASTR